MIVPRAGAVASRLLVESGTLPDSRHILASLETLPPMVAAELIEGPAL
jgi:hypothetical protein